MMNKEQAKRHGKKVGVKFYIRNSKGGLLGGTKTREQAEKMKREFQKEYDNDPFNDDITVYIEEL